MHARPMGEPHAHSSVATSARPDSRRHTGATSCSPREQTAPAFVEILVDADEERHSRGWRSIAVPASACVVDLRRMVFETGTCGVETDANLVLQTEDGMRLFAAMGLAEAGLRSGSRVVWRAGRSSKGLRKLLKPEAPTELHGVAKRQKTFALEMKFGGRPPLDPYSHELELVDVELPVDAPRKPHGAEKPCEKQARIAEKHAAGYAGAFVAATAAAHVRGARLE